MGTDTVGNGKTRYVNESGRTVDDKGVAVFYFWYGLYESGTYELRFIYGDAGDSISVRVPVTIQTKKAKQKLRIKLYDDKTGDEAVITSPWEFLLDGQLIYALPEWLNDKDGHVLTISDVPLGKHTLSCPTRILSQSMIEIYTTAGKILSRVWISVGRIPE